MSGSQAIERGFADSLLPADQMKVDEETQAEDRRVNELRSMELALVHAGLHPHPSARAHQQNQGDRHARR
jgi:ATP-dependent Clp protease protease subunit